MTFTLFEKIVLEALRDSALLLPFLFIVYLLVAWLEYRMGDRIGDSLLRARKAGPLLGSLFGSIPQCGFSVMSSALFARRLITVGTLIAVFIATSDEAVPVILAHPDPKRMLVIFPIVGTKILIALLAGFGVDAFLRAKQAAAKHAHEHEHEHDEDHKHDHEHDHEQDALATQHEHGCCDHHIAGDCPAGTPRLPALLWHPLRHTVRVFFFIFLVTLAMSLLIHLVGKDAFAQFTRQHVLLQPLAAAIFGLIPNCAASVVVAQLYLSGAIRFGAAIAGLSTGAGVGMLVLVKENPDRRQTLAIIGLLLAVSITAGTVLQLVDRWLPRFIAP